MFPSRPDSCQVITRRGRRGTLPVPAPSPSFPPPGVRLMLRTLRLSSRRLILETLEAREALHFPPPAAVSVGDSPRSVAVGDFNHDGKLDLAVANRNSNTVSVRLGDGAG